MARKLDDAATAQVKNDRFSLVEEKLSGSMTALPNISPVKARDPRRRRRNSSVSMPEYVWDLLGDKAHETRQPQNVVVMQALKIMGLPIDEADLIDPRKVRYKN
jgi:hypothetical protein